MLCCVIFEQLTQIQSDPYFGSKNNFWPSVFHPLHKSQAVVPWLVQFLPAFFCQTRLSPSLLHEHCSVHAHTVDAHACKVSAACFAFPGLSTGSSPVALGLYLSYSTCGSGQSLRDVSLTSLFVWCIDGWGAGMWVQEISTSQIRLINPQLKLLVEESCWIKNQISPGACR